MPRASLCASDATVSAGRMPPNTTQSSVPKLTVRISVHWGSDDQRVESSA